MAWSRDGGYCGRAMDAVGQSDSSRAFHRWTAGVIDAQRTRILDVVATLRAGAALQEGAMLPTRYTLSGAAEHEQQDAWPNFELDGYGTWIFAGPANRAAAEQGD